MRRAIPKAVRERVRAKFDGRCGYCGIKAAKLQIDHMTPYRAFWRDPSKADEESNLMPACFACNNLKNVYDVSHFRDEISYQVDRARQYSVNFRTAERFGLVMAEPKPVVFYFERSLTHEAGGR